MSHTLRCGRFALSLDKPLIMGILNVTPDSFSDGGCFFQPQKAVEHALQLIEEGADILDIGGESTRPGSAAISVSEEIDRVLPVIEALQSAGVPLSVDTKKAEVMRVALQAGADMINDVSGMRDPEAIKAVAAHDSCGVCIMHMREQPATMQQGELVYEPDVQSFVAQYLEQQARQLEAAGIAPDRIVLDPGFGFGKTPAQNFALIQHLDHLHALNRPVLMGVSRKSSIAAVSSAATPPDAQHRLPGSLAAALYSVMRGAQLLRVHDVWQTRQALDVWAAIEEQS